MKKYIIDITNEDKEKFYRENPHSQTSNGILQKYWNYVLLPCKSNKYWEYISEINDEDKNIPIITYENYLKMKKYTIEDLRNGLIAIKYDYKSLDKLKKIFKTAFPLANAPEGVYEYYMKDRNRSGFTWSSETNLPFVDVETFYNDNFVEGAKFVCPFDIQGYNLKKGDILEKVGSFLVKDNIQIPVELTMGWEEHKQNLPKEGDIIFIESCNYSSLNNTFVKVVEIRNSGFAVEISSVLIYITDAVFKDEKELPLQVGTYDAKFTSGYEGVQFGCKTFDKNQILAFETLLSRGDTKITIEDLDISLETVLRVKHRLNIQ